MKLKGVFPMNDIADSAAACAEGLIVFEQFFIENTRFVVRD